MACINVFSGDALQNKIKRQMQQKLFVREQHKMAFRSDEEETYETTKRWQRFFSSETQKWSIKINSALTSDKDIIHRSTQFNFKKLQSPEP